MIARRGDSWRTTQETVWTIIALTDYMVQTKELQADYSWGVALNGQPWATGQANAETLRRTTTLQAGLHPAGQSPALSTSQPNVLEVSRDSGTGNLYYTAHLGLSLPADSVQADSRGMTVQRTYCAIDATETPTNVTTCKPISTLHPGDKIEVRLTLIVPTTRYFVQLSDPYPAGFEPLPQKETPRLYTGKVRMDNVFWWWDPFNHHELRDEKAVFFANSLGPGTYRLTYQLRAAVPGTYQVLPATVNELYFPEVWGRSAGAKMSIAPTP